MLEDNINKSNIFLGEIISIYEAQTNVDELKSKRGGGDIITTLLVYAYNKGIISDALLVKMSDKEPCEAIPFVARDIKSIISASGSKYATVDYHDFSKELNKKSAIVGVPCQIKGCSSDVLKLGLFCGLNFSSRILNYLFKNMKVNKEEVKKIDYRAPYTKAFTVKLKNGDIKEIKGYSSLAYFFTNKKCLYCRDYTNHFTDISVGDRRPDWSVVITRTNEGDTLFKNAIKEGFINGNKISIDNFLAYRMTPLMQKEKRGGFINTLLVRPRGIWIEKIPLKILINIGNKIGKFVR